MGGQQSSLAPFLARLTSDTTVTCTATWHLQSTPGEAELMAKRTGNQIHLILIGRCALAELLTIMN